MKLITTNSTMVIRYAALSLLLALAADGFTSPSCLNRVFVSKTPEAVQVAYSSPLFQQSRESDDGEKPSKLRRLLSRFNKADSADLEEDTEKAGLGQKIKKLHDPMTYIALTLAFGAKHTGCFRNPFYWFGLVFFIKWYRARYVFKIPVWDRQPNWNNVITSKDQEKDLKAFTCKNCGSTIFIAKSREFFFEGVAGIGGLGCYACGAKGADNFVMDRERIAEEVADIDDYFEYERPLDFVTSAERRKILQEVEGDEEKANQLLVGRASGTTGETVSQPSKTEKTESNDKASAESQEPEKTDPPQASEGDALAPPEIVDAKLEAVSADSATGEEELEKPKKKKKKKKAKKPEAKKVDLPPPSSDDGLDDLGMDDF
jgi:hypothetical protein